MAERVAQIEAKMKEEREQAAQRPGCVS